MCMCVMVAVQMETLMAIIITAATAAVAVVGKRHHHHQYNQRHFYQKSSKNTKGGTNLWRDLSLRRNQAQLAAVVAESKQLRPKSKSKSKSRTVPTAKRSASAVSTATAFILAAAVAFTDLHCNLLGVLSINPVLVAAKAAVAVEEGSSANAEETEQQSPAAIVEEVIEVIRAAFISERDASRSKGPLSDTEIGYIVSNALSESAGPAAPASLSTDALAKEIAEYDYSSLRQRIHSMPQAYRVIRSVLKSLHDPYCRFLDPEAFATLGKYDMSGVGLNLGATEGADRRPIVIGLFLNGPAQKAGIERGDRIVAIDDQNVESLTPFEVSTILQDKCKAGAKAIKVDVYHQNADTSPVGVTIYPPESSRTKGNGGSSISVPLAASSLISSKNVSMYAETENGGNRRVAVIRIREMNADTVADVTSAIKSAIASTADDQSHAFVIDLRSNRGGLVSAGIETAGLFLDKGSVIVVTETSRNKDGSPGALLFDQAGIGDGMGLKREITTARSTQLTTSPLMLLVDGSTASAAEILAASLQDNCRAVVVGQKTFGKGLIQSVFELSDGSAIVLTVGNYLTPKMDNIDAQSDSFAVVPIKSFWGDKNGVDSDPIKLNAPHCALLAFCQGILPDIDRRGPFWTRPSFEDVESVLDACERP